jgi:hypothetical protein
MNYPLDARIFASLNAVASFSEPVFATRLVNSAMWPSSPLERT